MNRNSFTLFVLVLTAFLWFTVVSEPLSAQPSRKIPLADPFIMLHDDIYYAYGTNSHNGIEVWASDDLYTWTKAEGNAAEGLALHKDDVWGDRWFWAPEVYFVKGKFYMYYTANERICAATSDSPLGPFVQKEKKPMIANEQCIDNSLFMDIDGRPYVFFVRFNDGLNIWVAALSDDLLEIEPDTMQKCISTSQEWELKWPRVNEGVFVIRHGGRYYMTYSANSYESQYYGIGYAVADSVTGPWSKYEGNPIYQNTGGLTGIGHSAMFRDRDGKLRIVFHAHKDKTTIHPREMYIGEVSFKRKKGKPVMTINPAYITPLNDFE